MKKKLNTKSQEGVKNRSVRRRTSDTDRLRFICDKMLMDEFRHLPEDFGQARRYIDELIREDQDIEHLAEMQTDEKLSTVGKPSQLPNQTAPIQCGGGYREIGKGRKA